MRLITHTITHTGAKKNPATPSRRRGILHQNAGGPGGDRTHDHRFKRPLLYR
jgi:hypothetical protein